MTPAPLRLLSLGAALAAALTLGACGSKTGTADAATNASPADSGYTVGQANAPVKVEEFGSLTCPHCAHWEEETWPAFKAKYVDTGKVLYTFHEYLIHPTEDAAGGQLTRCVSKDKYFATVQAIFRSQPTIFAGDTRGALLHVAQSQGMTEAQFNQCLGDENGLKIIGARQQKLEDTYHVNETPTFLINGTKLQDAPTIENMSKAIDPLLAKK